MMTMNAKAFSTADVRMLTIDSIAATRDTLANGTYPIRRPLYFVAHTGPRQIEADHQGLPGLCEGSGGAKDPGRPLGGPVRFLSQLFAPSLLRALVGRTVAVAVGALLVLAAVALYESNDLISKQFEDEADVVAAAAAKDIQDQGPPAARRRR